MKTSTYFLILFPSLIFSQIAFDDEKILIDDSHFNAEVTATVVEDMDNDGDSDVISISRYDDLVLMYENIDGDLLYNPRILISDNVDYPKGIFANDLDNDGLKDVIVTSGNGDKIIWFKNMGANTFSEEIELTNNFYRPKKIISLDIDNDGDNDVLVNSSQDDNVFLLKNDGTGNFSNPEVVVSINDDGEVLNAIDINNDGLLDIISSNWSDEFYWSRNLGNGIFAEKQVLGHGNDLEFYDINNDTYIDAIGVEDYDNEVYYYLNQGGNSFGTRNSISTAIEDPYEIEMGDMDNDGISDIVIASANDYNDDSIGWFKNMGDETFGNLNVITTNVKVPRAMKIADIDNDGKQDVVCGDKYLSYKFSWFKNIDGYNFDENVINFYLGGVRCVKVADINNDGKKDIIAGQNKITWCENYGNNTFSAPRLLSHPNPVDIPFTYDFEVLDIDNDSDLDIISLVHGQLYIYENLESGDFQLLNVIEFPNTINSARELELGDLNGDGFFDLAISINYTSNDNMLVWFRNLGDNTFSSAIPIDFTRPNEYRPSDLKIEDIDNDGDNDIVTSSPEFGRINVLNNDGNGNFTLTTANQFIASNKLLLDDIDNDGDLDIVTAGYDEWGIYMRKNNNGTFGTTLSIDNFQVADDIFLEDINNDGFKDLIGTSARYSPNENLLFYYLNNNGTFGQKTIIDSKDSEFSARKNLYVADINNDNKKDILVGQSWEDQRLSYYTNESILNIEDGILLNDKNSIFYPNPVIDVLNWNISDPTNFYDIDILNVQGAIIYSDMNYEGNNISLSFLNPGMYFIRLSSNNQSIVKKIIKN